MNKVRINPIAATFLVWVLLCVWAGLTMAQGLDSVEIVKPTSDFTKPERFERLSGGATTVRLRNNADAFSQPSANISFEEELSFKVGNGIFKKLWVSSPSTTRASDGLGPLFNARSCQRCHLKDGRGHPPSANWPEDNAVSILVRLSVPPVTAAHQTALETHRVNSIPAPVYGGQLQDVAIQGHLAEGHLFTTFEDLPVKLSDGTDVVLRSPSYAITELGYGPMDPDTMLSVRVAPQMIGLGLLEAIDEADLRAGADPEDQNGDGVSGRLNQVWSTAHERVMPGRFGWKAGQPTLADQSAGAFSGDIGISSPLAPNPWGDCTVAQKSCRKAFHGDLGPPGIFEVTEDLFDLVVFYSRNLAVPARRDAGRPEVLAGKKLFYDSGCVSCHTPKYVTKRDTEGPEQSRQLIWPYTDLLLHDMGEGLADNRPDGVATGREWRTPPLWGIGLTEQVNGHTFFLHDGRARNLLEAILWHGGEAQASRDRVVAMSAGDRAALLQFLNSL